MYSIKSKGRNPLISLNKIYRKGNSIQINQTEESSLVTRLIFHKKKDRIYNIIYIIKKEIYDIVISYKQEIKFNSFKKDKK
ncbi:adenosylcobinamide kinase/adenosylcobinamide-phosphate guanylyltransferase (plasmid) [Bacillus thuringiensis serovar tolworthi]|uniref:Adenosylcobinamide kinase/adenosylcobinamide-phosphate guanylyltransferase n=1 Tax=Bacillus thuringiensis subsp. tolworthi TaxID=1442 RepID=A0A9W4A1D1_BACTO|nr:adenosylcobinamide kinase/adenosylcobinamide-phosphate guanylyltransferase [Bacillus thuringiensis serovar tolworthi]